MMNKLKGVFSGIKVRLTIWYMVILALVLVVFSTVLYFSLENYIENRVAERLQIQAQKILEETNEEEEDEDEEESYQTVLKDETKEIVFKETMSGFYNQSGKLVIGKRIDKLIPQNITPEKSKLIINKKIGENNVNWVVVTVKSETRNLGYLRLAHPLSSEEAILDKMINILIFIIPLILILASGGGYFLAHKALKPIDQISTTAKNISHNNLSQRITANNNDAETGRLIETLNNLLDRLEEAFSKEKQFTSDASHELRTPIAIIKAHVEENLKEERTKEEYQHSLKVIQKQVDYMSHLVGQLLLLARSDRGKVTMEKENLNLTELIEIVAEEMKGVAVEKNIDLVLNLGEEIEINADQSMLTQLLINLLDNAIKYTPSGGKVMVKLKEEEKIKIKISDTGIGIPEEEQDYIFNRFYRVDKSRSRDRGGRGLGLSICQWIVKQHHGEIELESEQGTGSTFIISLPVK